MKPNVYKYSTLKCLTAEIRLSVLNWIYSAIHRANNLAQTKYVYVLNVTNAKNIYSIHADNTPRTLEVPNLGLNMTWGVLLYKM